MNSKNVVAATLAIMAMLGFLVIFAVLGFGAVPTENKDFFNMGFIALIGFVGTSFGYYLGSSIGSARKTELKALEDAPPSAPLDKSTAGFIQIPLLFMLLSLLAVGCLVIGCAGNKTATPATTISSTEQAQLSASKTLYAIEVTLHLTRSAADASYTGGVLGAADYNKIVPVYNQALASAKTARRVLKAIIAAGGAPDASAEYATALAALLSDKVALADLMAALGVKEPTP